MLKAEEVEALGRRASDVDHLRVELAVALARHLLVRRQQGVREQVVDFQFAHRLGRVPSERGIFVHEQDAQGSGLLWTRDGEAELTKTNSGAD